MSRCKCGKKLNNSELKYKDPVTGEHLDYCFECIEASTEVEEESDIIEYPLDISEMEDTMLEEDFIALMDEIEEKAWHIKIIMV